LIDEFYAQEGVRAFPDSDEEAKSEQQAKPTVEESKVMTRSEYEKAGIHPPSVNKAEYPDERNRKSRSTSPKVKSSKEEKHTFADPKNPFNHKKRESVSVDMHELGEVEAQPQSEPSSLSNEVDSPEQPTPKVTFAAVVATIPKLVPPKTKPETKKTLPIQGENKSAKPTRNKKGKTVIKLGGKESTHYTPQGKEMVTTHDAKGNPTYHCDANHPLTMDQKTAALDRQMTFIKSCQTTKLGWSSSSSKRECDVIKTNLIRLHKYDISKE